MLQLSYNSEQIEAGCDEAGRGCLAGPVFAAAVILPKSFKCPKLNDSKLLSERLRYELRLQIEEEAVSYAVGISTALEIDEINILKASFLAMHRAIDSLNVTPEHLLIDGNRFAAYKNIPYRCIVKGDSKYLSIAAASILAKTYRDDYMNEINLEFPVYDWSRNKGYPTLKHRQAIEKYGISPYHRLSFSMLKEKQLKLDFK